MAASTASTAVFTFMPVSSTRVYWGRSVSLLRSRALAACTSDSSFGNTLTSRSARRLAFERGSTFTSTWSPTLQTVSTPSTKEPLELGGASCEMCIRPERRAPTLTTAPYGAMETTTPSLSEPTWAAKELRLGRRPARLFAEALVSSIAVSDEPSAMGTAVSRRRPEPGDGRSTRRPSSCRPGLRKVSRTCARVSNARTSNGVATGIALPDSVRTSSMLLHEGTHRP
mmetsp:Transcript_5315/g.14006  ORF Transcript_5315/g.14006 Transcript_5315/m.14006 type:complete len:227 (-) Transcript_5315:683-1363(-)